LIHNFHLVHLGDEIIEWNGHNLQNKTADEVYDILDESRLDAQVELIVSRPIVPISSAGNSNNSGVHTSSPTGANRKSISSLPQQHSVHSPRNNYTNTIVGSAVVSSGARYRQRFKGTNTNLLHGLLFPCIK